MRSRGRAKVAAHELEDWRLMLRLELAEHLIEKRGLTDEWKRSRR
jgi:hypothetical protein